MIPRPRSMALAVALFALATTAAWAQAADKTATPPAGTLGTGSDTKPTAGGSGSTLGNGGAYTGADTTGSGGAPTGNGQTGTSAQPATKKQP